MPNRFQVNQRRIIYAFLAARDGEYCLRCAYEGKRRGPPDDPLEIDHADGDPENWDPANLHLLCGGCNLILRGKSSEDHRTLLRIYGAKNVCVRVSECESDATRWARSAVDYLSGSPEMQANSYYEVHYRNWMIEIVTRFKKLSQDEAIHSGAEMVGCSPASAGRYLKKMCSAAGIFEKYRDDDGIIQVRYKLSEIITKKKRRARRSRGDKAIT